MRRNPITQLGTMAIKPTMIARLYDRMTARNRADSVRVRSLRDTNSETEDFISVPKRKKRARVGEVLDNPLNRATLLCLSRRHTIGLDQHCSHNWRTTDQSCGPETSKVQN